MARSTWPAPPKRKAGSQTGRGGKSFDVQVIGLNAVIEHMLGFAYLFDDFAHQILSVSAEIGVEEAQRFVQVKTGATQRSIGKDNVIYQPGGIWSIIYGPTTLYSPFLEYGTHRSAAFPFMTPSADIVERIFVPSVIAFLDLLAGGSLGTGGLGARALNSPQVRGSFTRLRSFLYTGSKFLGDISVFGGRGLFGPLRSTMLGAAKALGDVSSIMNNTMATRVTNRLSGRVTGKIIGYGSSSLSYSRTYSAFPGGSSGHRIYSRIAGRFGVSSLRLPGTTSLGFGRPGG